MLQKEIEEEEQEIEENVDIDVAEDVAEDLWISFKKEVVYKLNETETDFW